MGAKPPPKKGGLGAKPPAWKLPIQCFFTVFFFSCISPTLPPPKTAFPNGSCLDCWGSGEGVLEVSTE